MKTFSSFRSVPVQLRRLGIMSIMLVGLMGSAKATSIVADMPRRNANTERLGKMHPSMRPKISACLSDLEGKGDKPVIAPEVWRSPAQQVALVKAHRSTVYYSFHTVTGKNNKPESLAADIVDYYKGWNAGTPFWLKLTSSAQAHDLNTGIKWGLKTPQRQTIQRAVDTKNWGAKIPLGWDPAHTEAKGITLGQAKAGARPYGSK